MDTQETEHTDYGPGGYLPDRAARRARKIVLREQMGIGWPSAAVLAALVVAIAGVAGVLRLFEPPAVPFSPIAEITDVAPNGAQVVSAGRQQLLVVRGGGPVRVFDVPEGGISWCRASGRLQGPDGRVWSRDGRLVGGQGRSLRPRPSVVHEGTLYVNTSSGLPRPPEQDWGETPACFTGSG